MKLLTLVLLAACMSLSAEARRGGKMGQGGFKKIMQELNLSDEQKKQLREKRGDQKGAMKEHRKTIETAVQAYRDAWKSNADDSTLKSKQSAIFGAREKARSARLDNLLILRSVLDDTQKKTLADKMSSFKMQKMGGADAM